MPQGQLTPFLQRLQTNVSVVATNIFTNIGETCWYSNRSSAPIQLQCFSDRVKRSIKDIVGTKTEETEKTFWIPRQTNPDGTPLFPPVQDNIAIGTDTIVDTDGNTYSIKEWKNRDGIGVMYEIFASYRRPVRTGDVD